jgi:hypothetical protein
MANLFVGNLGLGVTDEVLQKLFLSEGFEVASAHVIRDLLNGASRGFGLVELGPAQDAARPISELNGFSLEGRERCELKPDLRLSPVVTSTVGMVVRTTILRMAAVAGVSDRP